MSNGNDDQREPSRELTPADEPEELGPIAEAREECLTWVEKYQNSEATKTMAIIRVTAAITAVPDITDTALQAALDTYFAMLDQPAAFYAALDIALNAT